MRLFAALPIPGEAVERLTRFRLRHSAPRDGLRWSGPEQWHITLQFYGEMNAARSECLLAALHGQLCAPVDLALEQFGLFAAKGILFASVSASAALDALHARIVQAGTGCAVLPESRPFRPHITLARARNRPGIATLGRMADPELPGFGAPIRWQANHVVLLESTLSTQGAVYHPVATLPLQALGAGEQR